MSRSYQSLPYLIWAFPIDETQWWPITAPIACSGWGLRSTVDVHLRSDPALVDTEDDLPAGVEEVCMPTAYIHYLEGDILVYARSQSGATTLYARFRR